MLKWFERNVTLVMIVLLLFTLIAPVLFSLNSFYQFFDLSKSGNIGDAIGGITAPFLGLLTIFLIYLTYKSQKTELEETRKIAEEQSKTMTLQRFENTFFKLMDNHAELIKSYAGMDGASASLFSSMRDLKTRARFYHYALERKKIVGFSIFNFNPENNAYMNDELIEKVINYINQIVSYVRERDLSDSAKQFYFTILFNSLLNSEKYFYGYQSELIIDKYHNAYSAKINSQFNTYYSSLPPNEKLSNENKNNFYPTIEVTIQRQKTWVNRPTRLKLKPPILYLTNTSPQEINVVDVKIINQNSFHTDDGHSLEIKQTDEPNEIAIPLIDFIDAYFFNNKLHQLLRGDDAHISLDSQLEFINKDSNYYPFLFQFKIESKGQQFTYYGELLVTTPQDYQHDFHFTLHDGFRHDLVEQIFQKDTLKQV
jgi:hypothetical protein